MSKLNQGFTMSNKTLNITDELYDYICSHSLRETQVQKDLRVETSTMELADMQIAPPNRVSSCSCWSG